MWTLLVLLALLSGLTIGAHISGWIQLILIGIYLLYTEIKREGGGLQVYYLRICAYGNIVCISILLYDFANCLYRNHFNLDEVVRYIQQTLFFSS
jgi:hypothetical protein